MCLTIKNGFSFHCHRGRGGGSAFTGNEGWLDKGGVVSFSKKLCFHLSHVMSPVIMSPVMMSRFHLFAFSKDSTLKYVFKNMLFHAPKTALWCGQKAKTYLQKLNVFTVLCVSHLTLATFCNITRCRLCARRLWCMDILTLKLVSNSYHTYVRKD